ncbi:hypothetical protein EE612_021132 [Oryza sativa]|nr:hypothetical protein EE612_021132 [Oryza sativa]
MSRVHKILHQHISVPVEEVPDAEDCVEGRVIEVWEVRRPLPLQDLLVLRLRPRVEPQDVVLHHARVRRHARLAVLVHLRAEGGGLGDELAGAVAIEAPAMVGALEAALAVDAPLRQRREAVRARVVHHAPLAAAAAVEPRDDAEAHHHLPVRLARVEVAHRSHGIPLVQPLEPPLLAAAHGRGGLLLLLGARVWRRRLGRHGRRRH